MITLTEVNHDGRDIYHDVYYTVDDDDPPHPHKHNPYRQLGWVCQRLTGDWEARNHDTGVTALATTRDGALVTVGLPIPEPEPYVW